jgi:hypothetical protein
MKLQVSLIPELMMDALLLITVISFTLGTYILYTEFKVTLSLDEDREKINFAEVLIGDKCVLAEINGTKVKGIFDRKKLSCEDFCVKGNFSIEFENNFIDCGCRNKSISYLVLIKDEDKFLTAKLFPCSS